MTARLYALIGGAQHPIEVPSFRLDLRLDEPGTCHLDLLTDDGVHFDQGQPVEVWWDAARLFIGWIQTPVEEAWTPEAGQLRHTLDCQDHHYLAGRRVMAGGWTEITAGDVAREVVARLAADGVTAGDIADGPILEVAQANYVACARVMDRLAEQAGFWWLIDDDRQLHFQPYTARPAPWNIAPEADGSLADVEGAGVTVTRRNPAYRNRQYVRGGRDVTDAQTERFRGDGDTQSFTVGYPLALEPAITVGGVAQTVGVRGIDDDSGRDWYWSYSSPVITQNLAAAPVASGTLIEVVYQGLFDVVVLSSDQTAIDARLALEGSGTGIVDDIDEQPDLDSRMQAFEWAAAQLQQYTVPGRQLTYTTEREGLAPGQLQTVTIPRHDLDGAEMLIESVDPRVDGVQVIYDIVAVEGPLEGSWRKFFQLIAAQPTTLVFRENISEDEVLVILKQYAKTWLETERPNLFLEPLPDGSHLPDGSITPAFRHDDRLKYIEWHTTGSDDGRKLLAQRTGLDTDEITTVGYLAPFEALGTVDELSWWGGHRATSEPGSGVEVGRVAPAEAKSAAEAWQVERIDRKWSP